jgi:hypothetical protein
MLVTLGTNTALSANASSTTPYACRSVQKVFIKIDDQSGTTAYDHRITIQLGQRTICNGVSGWGLFGMGRLQSTYNSYETAIAYAIDLGSHQLLDNENLYVTVQAGANALDTVDVSALVDEPVGEFPIRYTEYSDNVFTAENVLTAISYDNGQALVDEDAYNVEIRNQVNSSAPSFISACNWYAGESLGDIDVDQRFGMLCKNPVPLTTTFNYSSSAATDRILVASQMGTSQRAVRQGRNAQKLAQSQVGK